MTDPYVQAIMLARQLAEIDINEPTEDLEFPPPQLEVPGLIRARQWLGRQLIRLGHALDTMPAAGNANPSGEAVC